MSEPTRPKLEEDVFLSRILGIVLTLFFSVFGFYIGTVGGKSWKMDYQLQDMIPGFKGMLIGFGVAGLANLYIHTRLKKNLERDIEHEWYEQQAGHSHH